MSFSLRIALQGDLASETTARNGSGGNVSTSAVKTKKLIGLLRVPGLMRKHVKLD